MEPIFPKWMNRIPVYLGIGIPLFIIAVVGFIWYYFSPEFLAVGYEPQQPVEFSHRLHAGEMGMDCKYCHSTVTKASYAALPPTDTCMGCHNKVRKDSPYLKLVQESYEKKAPIPWVQVHFLPRYARFDHSAHLAAGVGCESCHGRVDKMDRISQVAPLSMGWCLECHRHPEGHLRPPSEVTNMLYTPGSKQEGAHGISALSDAQKIPEVQPPQNCSACHY